MAAARNGHAAERVVRKRRAEILANRDRVVDQLLRRALCDDPAILDEIAAIGDLQHLADVVIRQQDADPLCRQFADVAANVLRRFRIDGRERFIEQNEQRLTRQAACNFKTSLLATRTAGRRVFADVSKLKPLDQCVRPLPALRIAQFAAQ